MQDLTPPLAKSGLPPCVLCQVRAIGVCAKADDNTLAKLERHKVYCSYPAGSTIVYAGDELKYAGTIMAGVACISHLLEDGRRQAIGLMHPGNFLGRPGKDHAVYAIEAITDVTLCGFERKGFERLLLKAPELNDRLLEMMLNELDLARDWMLTLGRKTARERTCSLLVHLVYQQNSSIKDRTSSEDLIVDIIMTREQFGDFLALTLETVSRQFTLLKKDGFISPVGKTTFAIPDFRALIEEAGDDTDGDGLF